MLESKSMNTIKTIIQRRPSEIMSNSLMERSLAHHFSLRSSSMTNETQMTQRGVMRGNLNEN